MNNVRLPIVEVGLIAATRGMLGAGIGLLLAGRLSEPRRKLVAGFLLATGALSTIPLVYDVFSRRRAGS